MTVQAAEAHCQALPDCLGFTFHDSVDASGTVQVWFKSAWNLVDDAEWSSFRKVSTPTPSPTPSPTPGYEPFTGFISSGNDIEKSTMTVEAAKQHCEDLANCVGF